MPGTYQYTPAIWPSIFTIMLLIVLTVYAWRRRNLPGASWFVIYCLLAVPFLAAKVVEFLAVDLATKIIWFNVEYPWWMPGTTALTCFVLEYAWPGRWVTRRTVALLSIVPLLGMALLFTNHFHYLSFRGYTFTGDVVPLYGPGGWFFLVYNLGLRAVSIAALVWLFVRSPQHRWPAVLILLAETTVGVVLVFDPFIQESWFSTCQKRPCQWLPVRSPCLPSASSTQFPWRARRSSIRCRPACWCRISRGVWSA